MKNWRYAKIRGEIRRFCAHRSTTEVQYYDYDHRQWKEDADTTIFTLLGAKRLLEDQALRIISLNTIEKSFED